MEKLKQLEELGFAVTPGSVAGEEVYLVYPQSIAVKFTRELLPYRSSIWTRDMKPVSLGFKKFFNYTESSHIVRDFYDDDFKRGANVVEKIDGSCLIVSKFRGELIQRTRGTFDARLHETGVELDYLAIKYPNAFDNIYVNGEQHSLLYEWTTRANRIVLDYGEDPMLRLVGCIRHEDYSYCTQPQLDVLSEVVGVPRPAYFNCASVNDLLEYTRTLEYKEGFCVYFNNDQDIKKVKGQWYLAAHRFKSNCSIEYILDMFLASDCPDYMTFMESLGSAFDFECAPEARGYASRVCDSYRTVEKIIKGMRSTVRGFDANSREGRKEAAEHILASYGDTNRASFAFALLDGKELTNEQLKKLVLQCL